MKHTPHTPIDVVVPAIQQMNLIADATIEDVLEALVDKTSMFRVLRALGNVAALKADHLEEFWQDPSGARDWLKVAKLLEKAEDKAFQVLPR